MLRGFLVEMWLTATESEANLYRHGVLNPPLAPPFRALLRTSVDLEKRVKLIHHTLFLHALLTSDKIPYQGLIIFHEAAS